MIQDPKQLSTSHYDSENKPLAGPDGQYRGDNAYELKEILISSPNGGEVDIAEVFTQGSIYEDLFSNTMSASISFIDTNNIVKHLPIIGQREKLKIVFALPGADKITYKFDIFKVGVRQMSTVGKKQSVTIQAVSSEQFKNIHTRISKSYYGKIDSTVQEIYDEFLKEDKDLEIKTKTDSEKRKFIIPNWNPFMAINWLTGRSVAEENSNACNYIFYQDREGYKFTTIEKLFEEKTPKMQYFYTPRRYREAPNNFRDPGFEFRNIQRLIFEDPGNRLQENIDGMYGSKILTHDIVRKKYEFTEFNLKDEYGSTKHVDKGYPICQQLDKFSTEPDTSFNFCPIHKNLNMENELHGGDSVEQNEKYSEWVLRRNSLLTQTSSLLINITVSGDSRRKCGDVVEIYVTPLQPGEKDDRRLDKYVNGKYLVSSIKHNITPDGYLMDMELARDSVGDTYPVKSDFLGSMKENQQSAMK